MSSSLCVYDSVAQPLVVDTWVVTTGPSWSTEWVGGSVLGDFYFWSPGPTDWWSGRVPVTRPLPTIRVWFKSGYSDVFTSEAVWVDGGVSVLAMDALFAWSFSFHHLFTHQWLFFGEVPPILIRVPYDHFWNTSTLRLTESSRNVRQPRVIHKKLTLTNFFFSYTVQLHDTVIVSLPPPVYVMYESPTTSKWYFSVLPLFVWRRSETSQFMVQFFVYCVSTSVTFPVFLQMSSGWMLLIVFRLGSFTPDSF